MTKRRDPLQRLWQAFISQQPGPSAESMAYVLALRAEIDRQLVELSLLRQKLIDRETL
jgi:hypothetical protein